MGARRGYTANAHIGWSFAVLAAIALPCTAAAIEASTGARILYFEPLHSLSAPAAPGARKSGEPGSQQLRFDAYGRRFELSLDLNDRLMGAIGNGAQAKTGASSLLLYRGRIDGNPQSWARLAVRHDEVHGMIWDGAELYVIEPEAQVADSLVPPPSDASDTVIFRLSDVLIDPGTASCATDDSPNADSRRAGKGDEAFDSLLQELKNAPATMQAAGASRQLKISALGDARFLQGYSSVEDARDAILTRLNNVDGIFSSQLGVEIRVDDLVVNNPASDPLSSVTAPKSLLAELGRLRRRSPELNSRGLTHLFTGRELDGTTVGIAYMDSLCDATYGAGLTQAQSAWRDSLVAAHEIGHNFGADHDGDPDGACAATPSGFLMAPSVSGADIFSQCSLDHMRPRIRSASCITGLPPANVVVPRDLGTVRQAVSTPFEWDLEVVNSGGLTARDVRAEILVPPTVLVDDAYVTGGSCTSGAGVIQCQFGDMRGGTSRTIHLSLRSDVIGSSSISARVFSASDTSTANNSGDGSILIEPEADLAVALQGPSSATTAETFGLGFSVANRAMIATTDIIVVIDLPAGTTATNPVLGGSSCMRQGARIQCSLPSLAPGATANGNMSINVAAVGSIVLRARVSGGYVDPDSANDLADLTVRITAAPQPAAQTTQAGTSQGGGGSSSLLFLLSLAALRQFGRRSPERR